ncbi:MAG: hypothetical protein H6576_00625 [Lewinellaceae bacterium]|nr:hypothetical protein [Saprospiraceae bacterium]MCB9342182.1 hypothetical protein [Lewinellaceae bacterium]
MKQLKTAFTLSFICLSMLGKAQYYLADAIKLKPYFVNAGNFVVLDEGSTFAHDTTTGKNLLNPELQAFFSSYCGGVDSVEQSRINDVFDTPNPFMQIAYTSQFDLKSDKFSMFDNASNTNSASGNPVSFIADGIARFLVQRTKQELSLAFFAEFKEAVLADKNHYFKNFFRNTQQILLVIDTEVYQFQIYLEALRDAFITDLRLLPGNLDTYLREAPVSILKPAQQSIATDLFHIVQMFIDGEPAVQILQYLSDNSESEIQMTADSLPDLKNIATGFKLVNYMSQSLFNPQNGQWYSTNDIRKALNDPIILKLYFGLLWHHSLHFKVSFKNGVSINSIIGKAAEGSTILNNWKQTLQSFGGKAQDLDQSIQDRSNPTDESLSDNFSSCLQLFNRMLESVNSLMELMNPDGGQAIDQKYLQIIQQAGSLNFNVRQKNYSAAIGNTLFILDSLIGPKFIGKKELQKYGMFIAAVAESENPTEVQNAIELFSLPPGSSKAKKAANTFAIAINGYAGGNVMSERMRTVSSDLINSTTTTAGLAAPLGFSLNWGMNWRGKNKSPKYGSIGFFFPVIDVGAIYAYRFEDDGVENLPALEWKNIVAPGAYLVIDPPLGKWPLAFGFGGQMGPLLRKVNQAGAYENQELGSYRIGGFITMDIPINYLMLKN